MTDSEAATGGEVSEVSAASKGAEQNSVLSVRVMSVGTGQTGE